MGTHHLKDREIFPQELSHNSEEIPTKASSLHLGFSALIPKTMLRKQYLSFPSFLSFIFSQYTQLGISTPQNLGPAVA